MDIGPELSLPTPLQNINKSFVVCFFMD